MNEKSIKNVLDLAQELRSNNIRFFFHDYDRWMTSTDIDISLNSDDITNFHKIMTKNEFKLLSKFPPWKLFYVKYQNGDIIFFDTHLDAYEGVSKDILFPNSSNYFLDENKQLFYYIYRISIGQPCLIEIISPFVYYLEYLLRTLFLYPERIKYSAVLTDRWFYDLNTSPNASNNIVKFLNKLLPKPSLVVYLYNDIDVLITRKPDHPKSDLERQLASFNEIENIFDLKIKSGNKGEVINEIMDRIIKLL